MSCEHAIFWSPATLRRVPETESDPVTSASTYKNPRLARFASILRPPSSMPLSSI